MFRHSSSDALYLRKTEKSSKALINYIHMVGHYDIKNYMQRTGDI